MSAPGFWIVSLVTLGAFLYLLRLVGLHASRERAIRILRWLDTAIAERGHVAGIHWISRSRFSVPLRLRSGIFRNPSVTVQFSSRLAALGFSGLRALPFTRGKETVTFHADLDHAPGFDLELESLRLFARSNRKLDANEPGWQFETGTPVILTTRMDWQKEIGGLISRLASYPERDFLSVCFRKTSPHFSATVPLEAIAPEAAHAAAIFDTLQELATGAQPGLAR
jgi:hypothetical protein